MPADNRTLSRRFIILGVLVVFLIGLLTVNDLQRGEFTVASPTASYAPPLVNAELLENWLPPASYQTTIARINNFLNAHNTAASTMAITGDVTIYQGAYTFTILLEPQDKTHTVAVAVSNFGGILSTNVAIDGNQQGNTVPTQTQNPQTNVTVSFDGFDKLENAGATSFQTNALQTAFLKFEPSAANVSIDSIASPVNANSLATYTFSANIDGSSYNAKLICPSLNQVQLTLIDSKTNKQVFDSGVITQN